MIHRQKDSPVLGLDSGSRVAVLGGGPAGSFFSYFLIEIARRVGIDLRVDVYESRDFSRPGPTGCNMCGGIVSESLVQALAAEGINLPPTVVQRGIDSYRLHMDVGSVRIETPLNEMRIAAVHRGSGPRDVQSTKWTSFDGYLQTLVLNNGAHLVRGRVDSVDFKRGRPEIKVRGGSSQDYDLLAVAAGVNSGTSKLFETLGLGYRFPNTTKAFISEYYLGEESISRALGSSMHVFLLDIPRLEFAAIIPKGDYLTICLLGKDIDKSLVKSFLDSSEVKQCLPRSWRSDHSSCNCWPSMNVRGAVGPFADRVVFIGDCGVTRLYKDGIGAAYRTAKAAATTAVLWGVSASSFREHFWPICSSIGRDNTLGRLSFGAVRTIRKARFARRAILRMSTIEQQGDPRLRYMSMALWDMFTGSAPYKDIFIRGLSPRFIGRFLWNMLVSSFPLDGSNSERRL